MAVLTFFALSPKITTDFLDFQAKSGLPLTSYNIDYVNLHVTLNKGIIAVIMASGLRPASATALPSLANVNIFRLVSSWFHAE
jgi:hypothetical protein